MTDAWAEVCAFLDAQRHPLQIEGMDRWVDDGGPAPPPSFVDELESAIGLEAEAIVTMGSVVALFVGPRAPALVRHGAQSILAGYARRTLDRSVGPYLAKGRLEKKGSPRP